MTWRTRLRCYDLAHPIAVFRPGWTSSPDRDHQLSEMAAFLEAGEDLGRVGPGKIFANGAHLSQGDGAIHVEEILAGADVNSLDAGLLVQNGGQGEAFSGAGENTDLGDGSPHAQGAQGAGQGAYSAHFDNEIDAFAALFEGPAIPFGGVPVVQAGVEAEVIGALEFLVAAGNADDAGSLEAGELEREDGNSA